jgi:hypothetical protein
MPNMPPVAAAAALLYAECKMCYDYQQAAGATCVTKPETAACWGAAKRGYCSMLSALVNSYGMNSTEVRTGCRAACRNLCQTGARCSRPPSKQRLQLLTHMLHLSCMQVVSWDTAACASQLG